jgi:hypothetical protein
MKLITGDKLTDAQRQEALRRFIYRHTIENQSQERRLLACSGFKPSSIPPTSDGQWLTDHAFYIRKDGQLASKPNHCEPASLASVI